MKISTTHKRFAVNLGKPKALETPQDFLGPNYLTVINFWLFLDTLNQDQLKTVTERYRAARGAAWNAAWYAAEYAARDAAWDAARNVAGDAAGYAAGFATCELIGSHNLIEQGKSLVFVPMFEGL